MYDSKQLSLDQIGAFLVGAELVEFSAEVRAETCAWVERTLVHDEYARRRRSTRGGCGATWRR